MEQQASTGSAQTDGAAKSTPDNEQFYSTGRTGRRNALPDILGDHAHVTSSDLPARLQALTTSETNKLNPEDQPGPSRHTPEQN